MESQIDAAWRCKHTCRRHTVQWWGSSMGASLQQMVRRPQALLKTLPIFQREAPGMPELDGKITRVEPWALILAIYGFFGIFHSKRLIHPVWSCFQNWLISIFFPDAKLSSQVTAPSVRNLSVNLYGKVKKAPGIWQSSMVNEPNTYDLGPGDTCYLIPATFTWITP